MKTKFKIIMFVVALVSTVVSAQKSETKSTLFSVEIDPATFAFKGYSAHLRIQPKSWDRSLIGIGIYAMDVPELLVNLNTKNKDKGWNVRLNRGLGLFGEYYFTETNNKWFLGAQMSLQEYKIKNKHASGNNEFSNLLLMGYFGYTFKPFKNNFYIKPWAGFGYTSKIKGDTSINNLEYDVFPIAMFATLHVGYTFD